MKPIHTFLITVISVITFSSFAGSNVWHNKDRGRDHNRHDRDKPEVIYKQAQSVQSLARELEMLAWKLQRSGDIDDVKRKLNELQKATAELEQKVDRYDRHDGRNDGRHDGWHDNKPGRPGFPGIPDQIPFSDTGRISSDTVTIYPERRRLYPLTALNITNQGGSSRYVRIANVMITDENGRTYTSSEICGHNLYEKVYPGQTLKLEFRKPIEVKKVTMTVHHKTNGLTITGTPASKGYILHGN